VNVRRGSVAGEFSVIPVQRVARRRETTLLALLLGLVTCLGLMFVARFRVAAKAGPSESGAAPSPPSSTPTRRAPWRSQPAMVAVGVGLVTFLVHGYRLSVAPDVFSDEGIYLGVATNLANGAGLTLNHSVFLWHPPAYMFVEAAYLKVTGLANADPITALLSVRYLNVFFSASTAALLMLFGRKLHSYKAGLFAAALFLVDPYVERINRRSMLETLAMLLVLLGLYIFFTRRPHLTPRQRLGAGVAFGLAMLTKEAMFLELLGLVAYVLWSRRSQVRDVAWVVAIACAVYLPYPIWVIAIGQGDRYLFYQLFGVTRVLQSLPGYPPPNATAVPAPRATFSRANLQNLLPQYEMSYLLILLAGIFTVLVIFRFRHVLAVRYLATWSVVSFGLGFPLGRASDQYFYYMVVPSTLIVGYVLASTADALWASHRPVRSPMTWTPLLAACAVMFVYNGYVWAARYGVGSDNGYIHAMRYAQTHIPKGQAIVSSDDVAYYFLYPTYNVRVDRDPRQIVARCERYFIMSSKAAWGRYNLTTPRFYDWVLQTSRPLFVRHGHSFWTIGVYARPATGTGNHACS
jgi:4-amino-4-deoxy-L-arabinose transferase-like glycosyltransferase